MTEHKRGGRLTVMREQIRLHIPKGWTEKIREAAISKGMTPSEWLRALIRKALGI